MCIFVCIRRGRMHNEFLRIFAFQEAVEAHVLLYRRCMIFKTEMKAVNHENPERLGNNKNAVAVKRQRDVLMLHDKCEQRNPC